MKTAKPLTLGSLFDGIGGFPLAGRYAGIRPVWASEIEPFPIRVTEKRLPEMKHYGDIHGLHGAKLEPVDVITFGSPCQDVSIAGRREGLSGGRSGLFFEAIRIIREMRETTNLPKIIVPYALQLYEKTTERNMPIRRLGIGFEDVCDEGCEGYDLFTNWEEVKREKKLARATLELQTKFGKNAIIMASDLQEGATLIERNKLIGGHNADD